MKKLLLAIALTIGLTAGDINNFLVDLIKTNEGFKVNRSHTYYSGNVIWGEGFTDKNASSPFMSGVVIAFGAGWSYATITKEDGSFLVEVRPGSEFTIKTSDGNIWYEYNGTLPAISKGKIGE